MGAGLARDRRSFSWSYGIPNVANSSSRWPPSPGRVERIGSDSWVAIISSSERDLVMISMSRHPLGI